MSEKSTTVTDTDIKTVDPSTKPAKVKPEEKEVNETIKNSPTPPILGQLVEGRVIGKGKMTLYIDVPPFGTGLIYGREYLNARDVIKKINIGDMVTAKVVDIESDTGYIELSLKEAKQALLWSEAEKSLKHKTPFDLVVKEANKGGLILEWQGIEGFLPASQLKAENYPRVDDGDKDKIADELKKFIGQKIEVCIITADAKEGKLIFSEKSTDSKVKREMISHYAVGDTVSGTITGTVEFGVFIKIEEGLEGLVHISEIDWALVDNLKDRYKVGDVVKAKIIEVKDDKVSLSFKALKPNPWVEAEKRYKKGDQVGGVVIKYNKHGALVSVEEGVAGLVHISEFASEDELRSKLQLGKSYNFTINIFDSKEQKMTLSFGDKKPVAKEVKEETPATA